MPSAKAILTYASIEAFVSIDAKRHKLAGSKSGIMKKSGRSLFQYYWIILSCLKGPTLPQIHYFLLVMDYREGWKPNQTKHKNYL